MDRTTFSPPPQRTAVPIVVHADGTIEVFAEPHVDVHIARVPVAFSRDAEKQADEIVEVMLPMRFRPLFRRDRLRAVGTTEPLMPTVLARSLATRDLIAALNNMSAEREEVVAWT